MDPNQKSGLAKSDKNLCKESSSVYRLFVGGIGFKIDNKILRQHFEPFGHVTKALVVRDGKTKQSKGYGFITFSDYESLKSAMSATVMIYGLKADCHEVVSKKVLKGKHEQESTQKIFVGGISQSASKEVVQNYFSQFGQVLETRILYDGNTGKSRGFAFVVFKNEESKLKVLSQKSHSIKGKVIEVKEFESDGITNKKSEEKKEAAKSDDLKVKNLNSKTDRNRELRPEKNKKVSGSTSKADSKNSTNGETNSLTEVCQDCKQNSEPELINRSPEPKP